jgi:hypothetical protein
MFSNVSRVAVSRGPCKPRPTSMARSYFWLFADRMGVVIRDMDRVLNSHQHIPHLFPGWCLTHPQRT